MEPYDRIFISDKICAAWGVDSLAEQEKFGRASKRATSRPRRRQRAKWLQAVVRGHIRYYGVPMNHHALWTFRFQVGRLWHRALSRRSQNGRVLGDRMRRFITPWLPMPTVCHPYPLRRMGVVPERGRRTGGELMKTLIALALAFVVLFPPCLRAAPAKPALEVVVLGSGGPRPFGRGGSSFIVLLDGTPRILVDAGPGAFLRIGELDLDLDKVDTVLLTHLHIDHSGDLAAFFNARALTSDGPIVYHIFGPDGAGLFPKTSHFVDLLVGKDGAFAYQKTFGADETFTVRDLPISLDSPRTTIVDHDGLIVEEIATHHGDCPAVAYRISYKDAVLVFSGDMDASALPNLEQLAKNADLLIFNCAVLDPPGSPSQLYDLHTPPRKIGEAAHASGVKSLLLSHLAPDVESQEDAVRKSIRASYTGPVAFASDKERVSVDK
jgi:ribonuclease BN (tRNA processing enzyme)